MWYSHRTYFGKVVWKFNLKQLSYNMYCKNIDTLAHFVFTTAIFKLGVLKLFLMFLVVGPIFHSRQKPQNNCRSAFLEKSIFLYMVSGGCFMDFLRWKLTHIGFYLPNEWSHRPGIDLNWKILSCRSFFFFNFRKFIEKNFEFCSIKDGCYHNGEEVTNFT